MIDIKFLEYMTDLVEDEVGDAEKYCRLYEEYKHSDPELAAAFHELSKQECGHEQILHDHMVRLLKENPYPDMWKAWNELKVGYDNKIQTVKMKLGIHETPHMAMEMAEHEVKHTYTSEM